MQQTDNSGTPANKDEELQDQARTHAEQLIRESKELASYRSKRRELEAEIELRWQRAFDLYDLAVIIAQRAITRVANEYLAQQQASSPNIRDQAVIEALLGIQRRVCQTAKEIRVLLGAGYGPGAATRWRAIHELFVIATLIERHGVPLAERYLRHDGVQKKKLADEVEAYYGAQGTPVPPEIANAIADVRQNYTELIARYRQSEPQYFQGDYGWAHSVVGATNIADLEKKAGLNVRRYVYRLVSLSVHPNVAGNFVGGEQVSDGAALVLGPSNANIFETGASTVVDLAACTELFLRVGLRSLVSLDEREARFASLVLDEIASGAVQAFQECHDAQQAAEHPPDGQLRV